MSNDKLSPKQESWVQAYLASGNASQAYREVYASANMAAASVNREAARLLANPKITTRLATLRAEAASKATLSRAWVLERLMRNAEVALGERPIKLKIQRRDKETGEVSVREIEVNDRDASAANRALELLGKTDEVRLIVDRLEATGKEGEPLVPEQHSTRDLARAVLDILRTANLSDAPVTPDVGKPVEGLREHIEDSLEDEEPEETDVSDDFEASQDPPQQPRPLPTSLQSGERELVVANGAEIRFSDEYARYSVHDGLGRLAGWRRDLEAARALAQTLKPPPPPQGERPNGRG